MAFRHKSTLATTAVLVLVSTSYTVDLIRRAGGDAITEVDYRSSAVLATFVLIVLLATAHAIIAAVAPARAQADDQRDRGETVAGRAASGFVLALGVVGGMALIAADADTFWTFHTLLAALVVAELATAALRLRHHHAPPPTTPRQG